MPSYASLRVLRTKQLQMNAKVTGIHGELRSDDMISGHREIEGYSNENHNGDIFPLKQC